MKHSIKRGVGFGLVSGIITTLGLIVGLHSGTHSKLVVMAGILIIAITDAFSDALGIHISEEYANTCSTNQVWVSTITTFFAKFIFAMTFIIPVLLLPLSTAIIASIIWGLFLIALFSLHIAKQQKKKSYLVISEHVALTIFVIAITHFVGDWVATFGNI
jgi:VIT1/CCC1 family predicted Fe2+/Mn2+ transporter